MPRKFEYYDRVKRPKIQYPKMTGEYIDYEIKQVIKKTGDGEDDFIIEDKVIEKKTNIKKFIESFAKDVGIEGIIRKVRMTGMMDMTWLNQTSGEHADLTVIPDDPEEALKLSKGVEEAFAALDPELTKGEDINSFIKNLSEDRIKKYIDGVIAKRTPKGEEK